ncbi:MAG: hypothetical protein V1659_02195, partial [Candidatus Woesearchaeota archaeon]
LVGFSMKSKGITQQIQSPKTEISATLCYPYKTQAKAQVCFDATFYDIVDLPKSCKRSNVELSQSGQGAPVGITKIEAKADAKDGFAHPLFTIHFKNLQKGRVLTSSAQSNFKQICGEQFTQGGAAGIDKSYFNKISVKATISSNIPMVCSPAVVNLESDDPKTDCKVDESFILENKGMVFTTPLTIEADYAYLDILQKKIEIERIQE